MTVSDTITATSQNTQINSTSIHSENLPNDVEFSQPLKLLSSGGMEMCVVVIFLALVLHSQGLKISKVEAYIWSGYDADSETLNVLARHTALKCLIETEIRWYKKVVYRGSAVRSVALLPISAIRL